MPPVTNGQFSFNVDTFYVTASGGQIHRRAAPAEIKALYDTATTDKSTPDHPGHWYEAQLLHYGLPPSKVKATAKMRLLKALQDGALTVPKESLQIEKNLKKEWKKQGSEEQPQVNIKITTTKYVTTKTITTSKTVVSKNIESKTTALKAAAKPVATKAAAKATAVKTAATKAVMPKTAFHKKNTAPKTVVPKATAVKPVATKAAIKAADKPAAVKPATPKFAPVKRKRVLNDEEKPNQSQTAKRRVHGKKTQDNRKDSEPSGWPEQPEYDDVPPSYEYACGINGEQPYDALDDPMDIDYASASGAFDPPSPPRTLKCTLGLLNGTYKVHSFDIEDNWPHAMPSDGITLSLRLNGKEIWGTYEFGMFEGVLWMPERPMKPSFDKVPFKWRGRETGEGEMSFADDQEGWIEFLGDGDIIGMISCCGDLHFRGQRIDNCVRTASDLRDEWDGYNEEEYGRESRARWGGW
ncbi:DNA-repair protein, UmuC-like, N-terminal [Penicillium digitatum]|uniref:DNA-repair protein, UmuC-like, N-terminal n=1 Tax=Penicillium digitatum TaxID=36651 RepID=A0A7T6XGC5_PENDI|nr:DNA-repair protein, UmuC-like, N-terminal [Penicillium digitatum]